MESFTSLLIEWNKSTSERAKLQHTYMLLVVVTVVLAGLITLLNPALGHIIVTVAGFLFAALIANAIIWALLKTFVIDRIKQKRSK
jgi:uncharacterized membrane protein